MNRVRLERGLGTLEHQVCGKIWSLVRVGGREEGGRAKDPPTHHQESVMCENEGRCGLSVESGTSPQVTCLLNPALLIFPGRTSGFVRDLFGFW